MQSHPNMTFSEELAYFKCFCQSYYRAIIVITTATLMMVMAKSPAIDWFAGSYDEALILYGAIPCGLLIAMGYRSRQALALSLGHWRFWLPASALYLAVALPLIMVGAQADSMNGYYQENDFQIWHHLLTTALYLLGWEYFFRGFLLVGLREKFKEGAILLQLVPFTLLHFGKPDIETVSCILSGLVWGYICYRGNSFWPAFFMHLCVNIFTVIMINV